jgi:hypothetical protein
MLGMAIGESCGGGATVGDVDRADREGVKKEVNFEEVFEKEDDRGWGKPAVPDGLAVTVVVVELLPLLLERATLDAIFRTIIFAAENSAAPWFGKWADVLR